MSDLISFNVTGDRQTGIRFDAFPNDLYDDLKKEVGALSEELFGRVEADTPFDTGLLLGAERLRLFTDPTRITGYVDIYAGKVAGGEYAKAGALEYGAHRSAVVKTHKMRLDHNWSEKLARPEMVMVEAFTRKANIQEVAFLRGPLAQMQPEVIARLNAVVEQRVAEANA